MLSKDEIHHVSIVTKLMMRNFLREPIKGFLRYKHPALPPDLHLLHSLTPVNLSNLVYTRQNDATNVPLLSLMVCAWISPFS